MLFMVEMQVSKPPDYDSDRFEEIKRAELAYSQKLQKSGVWRHIWRVVGQYANVSIFDAPDNARLHEILMGLPLYPFMTIRVTALCRHPSSLHDDDR